MQERLSSLEMMVMGTKNVCINVQFVWILFHYGGIVIIDKDEKFSESICALLNSAAISKGQAIRIQAQRKGRIPLPDMMQYKRGEQ